MCTYTLINQHLLFLKINKTIYSLQVKELLSALGNNIGLDKTILSDLDLEKLVAVCLKNCFYVLIIKTFKCNNV